MSLDDNSRAYDPTYKPTKTLEQLVAENPGSQFLRDMLGMRQDAIKAREDYAPWVKLANDPKVPPRARQYYQELIDGDRRAGKHTVDVVETVRRILAKLRR
jgi:hypothetical protein